jgi:integrase
VAQGAGVEVDVKLPYLMADTSRHGKPRLRVRRFGHKVELKETPGTRAFADEYAAALKSLDRYAPAEGTPDRKVAPEAKPWTLGWLAAKYFDSGEFKELDSAKTRREVIESCLVEPLQPGGSDLMRDVPLSVLSATHIRMLRDRKVNTGTGSKGGKGAANNRKKYLSTMFSWGVEHEHDGRPFMTSNPARDVKRAKYATDGFHTWTLDEVRRFESVYPVGTRERLALALLLFVGVRRGDLVRLGRQHRGIRSIPMGDTVAAVDCLQFVPRKMRKKRVEMTTKPVLSVLSDIIAASPCGDLTYVVTRKGTPFGASSFGNWFRAACDAAGLPQCSAHGLRKAGATIAAEQGATVHQLMAMFDWSTIAQAEAYTRKANQKRLAGAAMPLLAIGFKADGAA